MDLPDEEMEINSMDEEFTDDEMDIMVVNEELNRAMIGDKIEMETTYYDESELESEEMKNYPHDLQMYRNSLMGKMSLVELENLGLERLEVLRIIDALMKEAYIKSEDFKECLLGALRNKGYDSYVKLIMSPGCDSNTSSADLEIRRRDHISHFILKVALCKKSKTFRWFIEMENNLFKTRFNSLNKEGVKKFLIYNNISFPILSDEEKKEHRKNLLAVHDDIDWDEIVFYKVPFLKVRSLIQYRKVFYRGGIAFLPNTEIIHLISQTFTDSLVNEREHYRNVAKEDPRLGPILKKFFIASQNVLPHELNPIDLEKLDEIVEQSFPLCMRTMHEALRKDHHLKNDGRFQYGMFLKIIGLSFDSAVDFWKEEFLKTMNLTVFEQKYLYNIKYVYGLVGQKANYQTYSCQSVISSRVGYGQYHGCPYKNMTQNTLNLKLKNLGVTEQGLVEIEDLVKTDKYREACSKCFYQVYKVQLPKVVESPVSYFKHSENEILRRKRIKIRMNDTLVNQTQESQMDLSLNKSTTEQTERNKENSNPDAKIPLST